MKGDGPLIVFKICINLRQRAVLQLGNVSVFVVQFRASFVKYVNICFKILFHQLRIVFRELCYKNNYGLINTLIRDVA